MSELNFGPINVAFGGGDLIAVDSVSGTFEDGLTLIHGMRDGKVLGSHVGKRSGTMQLTLSVSDAGMERDFFRDWEKGRFKEARCKLPGGFTATFTGRITSPGFNGTQDAATTMSFSLKGAWAFS
jgi:hypothetical protein